MIKYVSLDINRTIIDDTELIHEFWFQLVPKEYATKKGISLDEAIKFCKQEYDERYQKYGPDNKWISPKYWLDRFGIKKSSKEILQNAKSKVKVYDDTDKVVTLLSKKYKVIISTDHPSEFIERALPEIDIRKISGIFSSNDMGLAKYNTDFWKKVINALNTNPKEILHIGDSYVSDYIAPLRVGINTLLLNREKLSLIELIKIAGLV